MRKGLRNATVSAIHLLAIGLLACAGQPTAAASELADLVQNRDRARAIALIEGGADVNEAQGDGTMPLHWAVYHVDAGLAAMLIERGARPDVVNRYGSSPLGEAVRVASVDLVDLLLEAGADANAPNAERQTALMLAARTGSLAIAERLIEHGADVNARESWRGQSALIWAADAGFPDIVDLLIAHGAEVEFRAESQDWPSQITAEPRAQYRPVGGLTPLLYAARSGCTSCVRSILAAGADIDRPTPEGMTPLIVAIDNRAFDTARLLLDEGADPRLWDWYGRTALYVAVDMNDTRRSPRGAEGEQGEQPVTGLEIIEQLLDAGVDPNPQLNMHRPSRGGNIGRFTDDLLTTGATPLLRAAISQDLPVIRLLLAHGAEVDLPNVMGVTPLMAASGMGGGRGGVFSADFGTETRAIETIGALLEAGANVNARVVDEYDRTATIARGSSMTEREGHSALFAAAGRGRIEVVEFLIANGADTDAVDARGNTPADVARGLVGERGNVVSEDIVRLLETQSAAAN